jgi:magnesium-transporting ATPase (P-type)
MNDARNGGQDRDGARNDKEEVNPPPMKLIGIASLSSQLAALACAIGFPIWRLMTTGRFWPSFLRMWLFLFIWSLLFCIILPLLITFAFHRRDVFEYFPSGRGVAAMLMIGWFTSLILCFITWVLRTIWIQFHSSSKPN